MKADFHYIDGTLERLKRDLSQSEADQELFRIGNTYFIDQSSSRALRKGYMEFYETKAVKIDPRR